VRSLEFRLDNEDLLLDRANQRALFGWGRWGRGRVWTDDGGDLSTADGEWIIVFGANGWVGYLGRFGLLTLPVILLAFRGRIDRMLVSASLGLVLVANLIDLIPNSGLSTVTWLMAGAIVGRLEIQNVNDVESEREIAAPVQTSPYRRSFPKALAKAGGQSLPHRPAIHGRYRTPTEEG
jgi:hypothetical protein